MALMDRIEGSSQQVAEAAVVVQLHEDGSYTVLKNRYTMGFISQQILLVKEDGIKPERGQE